MTREHRPTAGRILTPLAVLLGTVAVLWWASEILVPIALAVLLSFLLVPLVRMLVARRVPRVVAVVAVSLAFWGPVVGLGWVVMSQFAQTAAMLPQYKDNIAKKVKAVGGPLGRALARAAEMRQALEPVTDGDGTKEESDTGAAKGGADKAAKPGAGSGKPTPAERAAGSVAAAVTSDGRGQPASGAAGGSGAGGSAAGPDQSAPPAPAPVPVKIVPTGPNPVDVFGQVVLLLSRPLTGLALVCVLTIFILSGYENLRDRFILVVSGGHTSSATRAIDDISSRVSRFLRAQLAVNVIFGLCVATGLSIIGVPSAILWGAMGMALRFVPYVGAWMAAVCPLALSLATSDSWATPAEVLGLFAVLELILSNAVEPLMYGASTGVSPIGLIVSAAFWTWLWGVPGLLLSTPITVCLVVGGKHIRALRFLNVLLSDDPLHDPAARFYQRALAGDAQQVATLAQEHLRQHGAVSLADDVLMPTLRVVGRDVQEGRLNDEQRAEVVETMEHLLARLEREREERQAQTSIVPPDERRVLIIPARDERDAAAGRLLVLTMATAAQDESEGVKGEAKGAGLVPRGLVGRALRVEDLGTDLAAIVEEFDPHVICVSAVPPHATVFARLRYRQIRRRGIDVPVMVGVWGINERADGARDRLLSAGVDEVVGSVADALRVMTRLAWRVRGGAAHAVHR